MSATLRVSQLDCSKNVGTGSGQAGGTCERRCDVLVDWSVPSVDGLVGGREGS